MSLCCDWKRDCCLSCFLTSTQYFVACSVCQNMYALAPPCSSPWGTHNRPVHREDALCCFKAIVVQLSRASSSSASLRSCSSRPRVAPRQLRAADFFLCALPHHPFRGRTRRTGRSRRNYPLDSADEKKKMTRV